MLSHVEPPTTQHLHTLLVVPDDDERQVLELALSIRGETVTACESIGAARQAMQHAAHAIVVLYRHVPEDDVLTLVRDIRERPGGDQTYIVLLATNPDSGDHEASLAAGADDYLAWPTDLALLRERFDVAERVAADRAQEHVSGTPRPTAPERDARILTLAADGTILDATIAAQTLFGFPPDTMLGVNAFSFFHSDDAAILLSLLTSVLSGARPEQTVEVRVRRDGGTWRSILLGARNHLDDPTSPGIVLVQRQEEDVSELGHHVTRALLYDAATDLPNHALFLDRLHHASARSMRHGWPVVVFTLDFNGFLTPEDEAPPVSDDLQLAVAQRLLSCLRRSDTAARLAPDEFGVILEDVTHPESISIVAHRVLRTLEMPFSNAGEAVELAPAMGIAISSTGHTQPARLLHDAEVARAWARVQGPGRFVIFDEAMVAEHSRAPVIPEVAANDDVRASSDSRVLDDQVTALHTRLEALERVLRHLHGEAP